MSFSDEELDALLGVYALDALDDDERAAVEEYLTRSQRAREEVRQHHEVAMALATTPGQAPPGLWNRIESNLGAALAAATSADPGTPTGADAGAGATVTQLAARASTRHRHRPRRRVPLPALAAAAFALVLGSVAVRQNSTIHRLKSDVAEAREAVRNVPAAQTRQIIERLLSTSGTSVARLDAPTGPGLVEVVVSPNGQGYLVNRSLPPLATGHVYQLWGVAGNVVLSLGVLGSSPSTLEFAAHETWTKFVLTDELSPGVASSLQPAFAAGDVRRV
jgi:Anti-sigma-K factor rskA